MPFVNVLTMHGYVAVPARYLRSIGRHLGTYKNGEYWTDDANLLMSLPGTFRQ
jgi:hypothetical protein